MACAGRRVDGAGRLKFDFHTGASADADADAEADADADARTDTRSNASADHHAGAEDTEAWINSGMARWN